MSSAEHFYRRKRYVVFFIITIIALALPFIKVNGNHFFLLSFDKKQFHLLFTSFDMQELYLIPFVLILLFIGIFAMTSVGGRIWCGWSCPQTIFRVIYRDLIQTTIFGLYKSTENKQKDLINGAWARKIGAFIVFFLISLIAASCLVWYFIPPEDFFVYIQNPIEHKFLIIALLIFTTLLVSCAAIFKENFCTYVCPYVRIQSVMYDNDTIQAIYDEYRGGTIYVNGEKIKGKPTDKGHECIACEACVKVCPTHIDIRKGVMQLECINCLECVDACTKIMGNLGKETLVKWSSPNAVENKEKIKIFRMKTIAYSLVLSLFFIGLLVMGSKKETMLLNIETSTELYKISKDGKSVQNSFIFLFQNTDSKQHTYFIELLHDGIVIKRPESSFILDAGKKIKKIVVLSTDKDLALNTDKVTSIPITIRAYAIDDEKIWVERKSRFIYPKPSEMGISK